MTQDEITQIMANICTAGIILTILTIWILIQLDYLTWENPLQHLEYFEIGVIYDDEIQMQPVCQTYIPPPLPANRKRPKKRPRPKKPQVTMVAPKPVSSTLEQDCVMAMKAIGMPIKIGTVRHDLKNNLHITTVEDYLREKFKK